MNEVLAFSDRAEIVLKHPDPDLPRPDEGRGRCRAGQTGQGRGRQRPRQATASRRRILDARLSGQDPRSAAQAGHRLAGQVVRHRGAIIPREAMPHNTLASTPIKELPHMTQNPTDLLRLPQQEAGRPAAPRSHRSRHHPGARRGCGSACTRLVAGGLRLLEITLRTPAAADSAAAIIQEVPEAVVGIGTVLTPSDLERARKLGARMPRAPVPRRISSKRRPKARCLHPGHRHCIRSSWRPSLTASRRSSSSRPSRPEAFRP